MVSEQAGDQVQGQGEDDGRVLLGGDAVQGLDSKHVNNITVHPTFTNICTMLEDRSMRVSVVCRTFSLVRPRDKECVWLVLVGDTGITAG